MKDLKEVYLKQKEKFILFNISPEELIERALLKYNKLLKMLLIFEEFLMVFFLSFYFFFIFERNVKKV